MKPALVLALLLSGCATMQEVDTQGQPIAYKDGYMAGCDSGFSAAGAVEFRFKKDVQRFNNDQLYKEGWDDGYRNCKSRREASNNMLGPIFR